MNTAPAARAPYPAHTDVRRTEAIVLWVAGVSPMWLVWIVVAHVTKDPRPWSLGLLLATTVLAVGVWSAHDWARWMVAAVDTIFVASCIWMAWSLIASGHVLGVVGPLGFGAIVAAGAWYALSPSVKRRFAEARESRAH